MKDQLYRIKPLVWERVWIPHGVTWMLVAWAIDTPECYVYWDNGGYKSWMCNWLTSSATLDGAIAHVEAERMKIIMAALEPVDGAGDGKERP